MFIFAGFAFEWRIEYRGKDGTGVSPDPSDPEQTFRVLTLYAIDDLYQLALGAPFGRALFARSPSRLEIPQRDRRLGLPVTIPRAVIRHPSPEAVGPASRLRRRYADAPAAALLTGLGAGEWAR